MRHVITIVLLISLLLPVQGDTISYSFADWPPIISLDDSGDAWGLYADIIHELFNKRLQIDTKAKMLPWKRAQASVQNGSIDFIITVPTKERLTYASASDSSFYDLYLHVFTWNGHPKQEAMKHITSAEDIKELNLIPVTNLGNGWHKNNIDTYGVKTHYVPAEANAVSFLSFKRADITIEALETMVFALKNMTLDTKIVDTNARFGPLSMHLLLSNKSSHITLLPKINRTYKAMIDDGTVSRILKKYRTTQ